MVYNILLPDRYAGVKTQEETTLELEDSVVFVVVYEFQTFLKCSVNEA